MGIYMTCTYIGSKPNRFDGVILGHDKEKATEVVEEIFKILRSAGDEVGKTLNQNASIVQILPPGEKPDNKRFPTEIRLDNRDYWKFTSTEIFRESGKITIVNSITSRYA